ncbi:MAG: hypothetical protein QXG67_01110 [Candidatus Nitrosotenuis sp.]
MVHSDSQESKLFTSLRLVGFEKSSSETMSRRNVHVSLYVDGRTHWYVTTPHGKKDYRSQGQALHALVGYRLVTCEDLEVMAKSGYQPAKTELGRYLHTIEAYTKRMISDMKNQLPSN